MTKHKLLSLLALSAMLAAMAISTPLRSTAQGSRTFPETGKTVAGRFLEYWDANGGLAQQGFPISEVMEEQSDTDGEIYTVQYFERAVFEMHPENDEPYDVLLSLLGTFYYYDKYDGNAPGQKTSTSTPRRFAETGKTIGGKFRKYWEEHGGLAQQSYPISNEFQETSDTDGKKYTVQYFERAVFELHPEKAGTQYEVQLSLLGSFFNISKYGDIGGGPSLVPRRTPTPRPAPTATPLPAPKLAEREVVKSGWTHIAATTNDMVIFYEDRGGTAATARITNEGVLTPLRRFPSNNPGFDSLFHEGSHLVPGHKGSLFFYRQKNGDGLVFNVHDDGTLFSYSDGKSHGDGWSHVQIDPVSRLGVFYRIETGELATVEWNENEPGHFRNLAAGQPAGPEVPRWKHILPVGNGNWFMSSESPGNFRAVVAYGNSAGQFVVQDDIPGFQGGWTHVVAAGSRMILYNKNAGTALAAEVSANGKFKVLKSYQNWPSTWEVFATQNGLFIFYDPGVGIISIESLNEDGTFTELVRYEP